MSIFQRFIRLALFNRLLPKKINLIAHGFIKGDVRFGDGFVTFSLKLLRSFQFLIELAPNDLLQLNTPTTHAFDLADVAAFLIGGLRHDPMNAKGFPTGREDALGGDATKLQPSLFLRSSLPDWISCQERFDGLTLSVNDLGKVFAEENFLIESFLLLALELFKKTELLPKQLLPFSQGKIGEFLGLAESIQLGEEQFIGLLWEAEEKTNTAKGLRFERLALLILQLAGILCDTFTGLADRGLSVDALRRLFKLEVGHILGGITLLTDGVNALPLIGPGGLTNLPHELKLRIDFPLEEVEFFFSGPPTSILEINGP